MKARIDYLLGILTLLGMVWGILAWWGSHTARAAGIEADVTRLKGEMSDVERRIRNIGVLQIRQGEEQRALLLEIVGRPGTPKPDAVSDAEAAVLADP